jgi:hypothetical protein
MLFCRFYKFRSMTSFVLDDGGSVSTTTGKKFVREEVREETKTAACMSENV